MGDDEEHFREIAGQFGAQEAAMGQPAYQANVQIAEAQALQIIEQTKMVTAQVKMQDSIHMGYLSKQTRIGALTVFGVLLSLPLYVLLVVWLVTLVF